MSIGNRCKSGNHNPDFRISRPKRIDQFNVIFHKEITIIGPITGICLTAGLPVNLEGLVGANGKVFGLESFGFSAPYKVLDEKLGFTAQNVYNQVKEMLA